jgi:hypothetical protein
VRKICIAASGLSPVASKKLSGAKAVRKRKLTKLTNR